MSRSRIITFQGNSAISAGISLFTGSQQTHVGWQTPDGTLWEAVGDGFMSTPPNGQDLMAPFRQYHPHGVVLHFFEYKQPLTLAEEEKVREFLEGIQGSPYAFRTLFTFMLNPGKDPEKDRVICSEAVLGASIHAGRPLLERIRPWNCSPADIFHSPLLEWKGSYTL